MEWLPLIIQVLFLLVYGYWFSYANEKGKNRATSQDIKGIERQINEVKSEIENISFKKQDRFIQFKESLLELNREFTILVEYTIKDIGHTLSNSPSSIDILESSKRLILQQANAACALGKVEIYAIEEDHSWLCKLHDAYNKTMPLYGETVAHFENCLILSEIIKFQSAQGKTANEKREEYVKAINKYKTVRDEMQKESFNALNEIRLLIKERLNSKYES